MTRLALLQEQSMEVDGLRVALRTEKVLMSNGRLGTLTLCLRDSDKMLDRLALHLDRILAEIEKEEAYLRLCRGGGE